MRKPRSDTSTALVQAHADNRASPVQIPPHLHVTPEAVPFLASILEQRAPSDWVGLDVMLAAQAAELTCRLNTIWSGPLGLHEQVRIDRLLRHQLRLLRGLHLIGSRKKTRVRVQRPSNRDLLAD